MFTITISPSALANLKQFLLRTDLKGNEVSAFYEVFKSIDEAKAIGGKQTKSASTKDEHVISKSDNEPTSEEPEKK